MYVLLSPWGNEPRQSKIILVSTVNHNGQVGIQFGLRKLLLHMVLTKLTADKVNIGVSRNFQDRCIIPLIYGVLQCRFERLTVSTFSETGNLETFHIAPALTPNEKKSGLDAQVSFW